MNNNLIIPELNYETIESMVYEIRGQKVMLDFDLAKIYGYETKALNQQVKNNIAKFPERYRFQLTKEELEELARSKFLTAQIWATNKGGRTSLPYVFTEQGIYMLMTVLKGELATKQSIALIDAFKFMKDYIVEKQKIITTDGLIKLTSQVNSNTSDIKTIKKDLAVIMDNFINPNCYKEFVLYERKRIDADIAYQSIYKLAEKTISIVDDYIDVKTLQLLKVCDPQIKITIISDNKAKNKLNQDFITDFKKDTSYDLTLKKSCNMCHDRLIILDYNTNSEKYFLCGGSSKDAGDKISVITQLDNNTILKQIMPSFFSNPDLIIK